MDTAFSFDYRTNNGNLYLDLKGHYDESAAKQVVTFLDTTHKGTGKIFISAFNVQKLTEKGMHYFKNAIPQSSVSATNLYLKGEKGIEMMPEGSKMLLLKESVKEKLNAKSECKCGGKCGGAETGHGKCKTCKCALKKRLLAQ